jgi:hypothetical protein
MAFSAVLIPDTFKHSRYPWKKTGARKSPDITFLGKLRLGEVRLVSARRRLSSS